jgi:predicted sugar kinase
MVHIKDAYTGIVLPDIDTRNLIKKHNLILETTTIVKSYNMYMNRQEQKKSIENIKNILKKYALLNSNEVEKINQIVILCLIYSILCTKIGIIFLKKKRRLREITFEKLQYFISSEMEYRQILIYYYDKIKEKIG